MVKLIHCADLHLDAPMESTLPERLARERRAEIRATLGAMVRDAEREGVAAILFAGDVFDCDRVTVGTKDYFLGLVAEHPRILFCYLSGNHDKKFSLADGRTLPANLILFGDAWNGVDIGEVTVTGSEAPDFSTLRLNPDRTNILLLHGQVREGAATGGDLIGLGSLKNRNIRYVAMGHYHEFRTYTVDAGCVACYSGCLEGRGFDECGPRGYVLLEADHGRVLPRFVPIAKRELIRVSVDLTGCLSQSDAEGRVLDRIREIPEKDLVRLELVGETPTAFPLDVSHLQALLDGRFYFAKTVDGTRLSLRPEDFRADVSLKGEFVRRVTASDLPDEEKERVLRLGFRVLLGEEAIL